ncbi:MAG: serine/threonine protein kinase [Planctomycetes bacterium]|nr:serine/threonine protein kinase [Planctomycetota bacterium]
MSSQTAPARIAAGTVLGDRFELGAVVGEGAMGVVYRATDRLSDRPAAVKVMKAQLSQSREFVGRFKREARAASRFRHPAAVAVLATGETEDRLPYIAMELIEGRSLDELIRAEAPLASGRACNLIHQLLRALATAHKLGIVHRDMKPANIRVVVDADGIERPKILDFGVAKFVRGDVGEVTGSFKTKTGMIVGTPKYMAPEQIRGDAIDGRADIYAVGAMFHEMLTGKPPFEADDVFGFVALHLKQQVASITQRFPDLDVPPEVDEVVLRMLEKEPKSRPEDGAILADELERWSVEDPKAAQKSVELKRGVIAVVVAGVVGAGAAWVLGPAVAPVAAAASLALAGGAAFAATRFGRPSVWSYVKRIGVVLGSLVVLCAITLFVPGSPGLFVTVSFVLAALVVYAAFLIVWNAKVRFLRFAAAGVVAPLLCLTLFPVRIDPAARDPYYVAVYDKGPAASADTEGAAKKGTALALLSIAAIFGLASIALPRPGAARRT